MPTRFSPNELKLMAAVAAAEFVQSGMVVGLGSGSTASLAILELGRRLQEGALADVVGVPTSNSSARLAEQVGVPLTTLAEHPLIDLTIDGADEVDPDLNLIKGLGGALLREKIVAQASERLVIVVDESKLVDRLGTRAPVPVEVIRFGWRSHLPFLESLGARPVRRLDADGGPVVTDEGNFLLDCHMTGGIEAPQELARRLKSRAGLVEHGLFLGLATEVVVSSVEGIRVLRRG